MCRCGRRQILVAQILTYSSPYETFSSTEQVASTVCPSDVEAMTIYPGAHPFPNATSTPDMGSRRTAWARLPERRPLVSLVFAVVVCIVVGSSGSAFTTMGLVDWYPTLTKPALAPPDWVFGPVWTVLFTLMGVAVWLIWREITGPDGDAARLALVAFAVQFVVNVAWSAAFFGLRSIEAGLVVIAVLWVAIVVTLALFYRVDHRAAVLLVPYLAWVSFAAYLNYAFWALN